jgi:Family of unknown function (DUF6297)
MTAADSGPGGTGWLVGAPALPAAVPLRRLRAASRLGAGARLRFADAYAWGLVAAVLLALVAGVARPLVRLLARGGWAVHGAPGHLFVAAAVLLLVGLVAQLLGVAGPVTASAAFRFWLLAAPVRRRDLLRRRFVVLLAVVAAATFVVAAILALAGSVPVAPTAAVAALAALTVSAGAVWGQASEQVDRLVHVAGQAMKAVSVLGFGSLATGVGRTDANRMFQPWPTAVALLIAVLGVAALACGVCAYRALDRIDLSVLRRGQGLLTAGHVAAMSMDTFILADFLEERRALLIGRVRPARVGPNFAVGMARSQARRVRRRPYLLASAAIAAVVWWGCRAVLPPPVLAAVALIFGYLLLLPLAGTLRQLASSPGLRAQFAPRDRWVGRASAGACLVGAAAWTAVILPGLAAHGTASSAAHAPALLAVIIPLGISGAVLRTVTRPPLDYSAPPTPTIFGDLPLDLWRQLLRGPLLLLVLILVVLAV